MRQLSSPSDARHSSFSSVQAWRIVLLKILRHTIITKIPWSCSRAKKNTYYVIKIPLFTDLINRCELSSSIHIILKVKRSSDAESIFWILEQLHGIFSDIGAHHYFQKPDSFMPELLIKQLCIMSDQDLVRGIGCYRS